LGGTIALQECEGRLRGYGSEEMALGGRRVRNWEEEEEGGKREGKAFLFM